MKTIHPGHLEHRFCIFGCQILCITDLAIMPQKCKVAELQSGFRTSMKSLHHHHHHHHHQNPHHHRWKAAKSRTRISAPFSLSVLLMKSFKLGCVGQDWLKSSTTLILIAMFIKCKCEGQNWLKLFTTHTQLVPHHHVYHMRIVNCENV